jgi:hypothetical protein
MRAYPERSRRVESLTSGSGAGVGEGIPLPAVTGRRVTTLSTTAAATLAAHWTKWKG